MKCYSCENDARYVREDGKLTCALHAMGFIALRVSDLAAVLRDIRIVCDELEGSSICPDEISHLRAMLGILASNVRPSR